MAYQNVNAVVKEFDDTNGEFVISGEWLVFKNGAMREVHPMGRLIDPPANEYERAKITVHYHKIRLQLAVEQFDREKLALSISAKTNLNQANCPHPGTVEDTTKRLKELKGIVADRAVALKLAEEELEKYIPKHIAVHSRIDAENRAANQKILEEIQAIEI